MIDVKKKSLWICYVSTTRVWASNAEEKICKLFTDGLSSNKHIIIPHTHTHPTVPQLRSYLCQFSGILTLWSLNNHFIPPTLSLLLSFYFLSLTYTTLSLSTSKLCTVHHGNCLHSILFVSLKNRAENKNILDCDSSDVIISPAHPSEIQSEEACPTDKMMICFHLRKRVGRRKINPCWNIMWIIKTVKYLTNSNLLGLFD